MRSRVRKPRPGPGTTATRQVLEPESRSGVKPAAGNQAIARWLQRKDDRQKATVDVTNCYAESATEIYVTWTSPFDLVRTAELALQKQRLPGGPWETVRGITWETGLKVGGLEPGTRYNFRVVASGTAGKEMSCVTRAR